MLLLWASNAVIVTDYLTIHWQNLTFLYSQQHCASLGSNVHKKTVRLLRALLQYFVNKANVLGSIQIMYNEESLSSKTDKNRKQILF